MNPASGTGGARVTKKAVLGEPPFDSTPAPSPSNVVAVDLAWSAFVRAVNAHRAIRSVHSRAAASATYRSFDAIFCGNDGGES